MERSTDFMFTASTYVCGMEDAWQDILRRGFARSCAHFALGLAVVLLSLLLTDNSVGRAVVLVLVTMGTVAFYQVAAYRRLIGTLLRIVDTCRDHDAKGGAYASPETVGLPSDIERARWLGPLLMLPILGPIVAGFTLLKCRQVVDLAASGTVMSSRSLIQIADDALLLYLAYPDSTYRAPSDWYGVWTPAQSLNLRRNHVASAVAPFWAFALTGMALTTALVSLFPGWWSTWIVVIQFLGCVASAHLPRCVLRATLCRAIRTLTEGQEQLLPPSATEWDHWATLVEHSTYESDGVALRDHLFVGFYAPNRTETAHPWRSVASNHCPAYMPALVHSGAWHNHIHYTGGTQQGKTTLGVIGLLDQVLRGRKSYQHDAQGMLMRGMDGLPLVSHVDHTPTLVLDFKGDEVLRNTLMEECERRGRTFKMFTLEQGKATSYFNPINDLDVHTTHPVAFCELVCSMLGLYHGLSYGRGYFSKQSRDLMIRAVQGANPKPRTWEELYRTLQTSFDPKEHRDVFELMASVMAVSMHPVLGEAPNGLRQIHMPTAIDNNEVLYFCLPATVSAFTVRDVGRMALYCWLDAATKRARGPGGRKRTVVVMDEAQIICGEEIQTIFQQASASAVTCVLANQSIGDLDSQGVAHMSRVVRDNTRVKQAFSILDSEESRRWVEWSGESVGFLRGVSYGPQGMTTTYQPSVHPRMTLDVVWQTNNEANTSLLHVASTSGFTRLQGRPARVWTPFTMSTDTYLRRQSTPWPESPVPASTTSTTASVAAMVTNAVSPEASESRAKAEYAHLEALYGRLATQLGSTRPKGGGR